MVAMNMNEEELKRIQKFRIKKELTDYAINEYAYTLSDNKKLAEMKQELIDHLHEIVEEVAEGENTIKLEEKVIIDEKTTEQVNDREQELEIDVSVTLDEKRVETSAETREIKQENENQDLKSVKIFNFINEIGSHYRVIPANHCRWKNKKLYYSVYEPTFKFIGSVFDWEKDFSFKDINNRSDKHTIFAIFSSILFYKKFTLMNLRNEQMREFSIKD